MSELSTEQRLAEIAARVEAANPLPWVLIKQDCKDCGEHYNLHGGRASDDPAVWWLNEIVTHQEGDEGVALDEANGDFLANAPTDVRWLLAEVARLTAERDAAIEALDAFAADLDQLNGEPVIA